MQYFLDFEKPLVELEQKIRELRDYSTDSVDFSNEIKKLEKKAEKLRDEIFSNLTRWQRTQLARHQKPPYTLDYVKHIFTDWSEVHGDRNFRDDRRWSAVLPLRWRAVHGYRPPKRARHQGKGLPELRHAQPGRLPQGVARDAAGRAVPVADLHVCRHPGCFPGDWRHPHC